MPLPAPVINVVRKLARLGSERQRKAIERTGSGTWTHRAVFDSGNAPARRESPLGCLCTRTSAAAR